MFLNLWVPTQFWVGRLFQVCRERIPWIYLQLNDNVLISALKSVFLVCKCNEFWRCNNVGLAIMFVKKWHRLNVSVINAVRAKEPQKAHKYTRKEISVYRYKALWYMTLGLCSKWPNNVALIHVKCLRPVRYKQGFVIRQNCFWLKLYGRRLRTIKVTGEQERELKG